MHNWKQQTRVSLKHILLACEQNPCCPVEKNIHFIFLKNIEKNQTLCPFSDFIKDKE